MINKTTQKARKEILKNPFESGADVITQIKDTAKEEFSEDWRIAMRQMLGIKEGSTNQKASGDLSEGEELIFSKIERKLDVEPGINYFREIVHAETTINRRNESHLETKIQEIVIELKKLSESSRELQLEFKDIATATLPVKPGKYHLNFFEWMLITIQNARMRIEDSTAWLGVISSKKGKKDYWTLVKNQGTNFMLSGERTSATQVG